MAFTFRLAELILPVAIKTLSAIAPAMISASTSRLPDKDGKTICGAGILPAVVWPCGERAGKRFDNACMTYGHDDG